MVLDVLGQFINDLTIWLDTNLYNLILYTISLIVIYTLYRFFIAQVKRLDEQGRLDINASFLMRRVLYWGAILISLGLLFGLFGIRLDLVAGLTVLAGGTVVGFAAINTIGNAIAGIIVMLSRPFEIGDRISYQGDFADVEEIDLIYTRMRTLDNVLISLPNQELLERQIENYGKDRILRRKRSITAGYDVDKETVENALFEAASRVEGILQDPEPYVWITELGNFAAEYTLYFYVNDVRILRRVEADVNREVLESFRQYGIDPTTPNLIRST